MKRRLSRRAWMASGAAIPFALETPLVAAPGQPPYTLSINIEIMFPRSMPRAERMKAVAAQVECELVLLSEEDIEQAARELLSR